MVKVESLFTKATVLRGPVATVRTTIVDPDTAVVAVTLTPASVRVFIVDDVMILPIITFEVATT